jgi:hypothetical protein
MINSNSRQDITMLDVLFTLTPNEAVLKFNKRYNFMQLYSSVTNRDEVYSY